ncbi:MAG: hypothetical protein WCI75_16065, partial [candidate division NC10 bacterium]
MPILGRFQADYITAAAAPGETPPTANFAAQKLDGQAPLAIHFLDRCEPGSQPILVWTWDFGDGTSSAEPNP